MFLLAQRDIRDTQSATICRRARQYLLDTIAQKNEIVRIDEIRRNHINRTQQKLERLKICFKKKTAIKKKQR
jgi:hypothetical protein